MYSVSRIIKLGNNEPQLEELILTMTGLELKEKDLNKGNELNKWFISSLESCVKLESNVLQLKFDSVQQHKTERTYKMEELDAYELYKTLKDALENRIQQDMDQSSQSSKMINRRDQGEHIVIHCTSSSVTVPPCIPDTNSENVLYNKLQMEVDQSSPIKPIDAMVKGPQKAKHNRSSSAGVIQAMVGQKDSKVVKCSSQSSIGEVKLIFT